MIALPQLIEEDIQTLDAALNEFLTRSEASLAFVIDKAGFLITQAGDRNSYDTTTIGALAANAFAATQAIASIVNEPQFNSLYHQGQHCSLLVQHIDDNCLLVVIFKADISVGAVKYYSAHTITTVGRQLGIAYKRDPRATLDLASINMADTSSLFRKKKE